MKPLPLKNVISDTVFYTSSFPIPLFQTSLICQSHTMHLIKCLYNTPKRHSKGIGLTSTP